MEFNDGRPYHGSEAVTDGKLTGATDQTDYFYFMCPKCPDKRLLRLLDHTLHASSREHPYKDHVDVVAKIGFTIAFKLLCDHCLFTDFVKISNMGWQGGTLEQALSFPGGKP